MPNREACCTHLKEDVEPGSRGASHTDLQEDKNVARRGACRTEREKDVEPGSRGASHPHLKEDEEPRRRVQIQGDLAKDGQTKMWPSQTTTETGRDACWKQSMEVRATGWSVGADWTEIRGTAGVDPEHGVVGPTAEQRIRSHWERTWRCGKCRAKGACRKCVRNQFRVASSTVSNDRGDVTAVLGQQHPADTAPQLTGDGDEDPGGLSSGLREAGMYERDPRAKEEDLYRMPTLSTAPNEVAWNGSNGKEDGTLSLTNRPERALVQSLVMPSPTIFCVSASGKYQEEGDEIRVLARTPDGDTQSDLTEGVVAVAEFPQSLLPPSPGGVSPARREKGET